MRISTKRLLVAVPTGSPTSHIPPKDLAYHLSNDRTGRSNIKSVTTVRRALTKMMTRMEMTSSPLKRKTLALSTRSNCGSSSIGSSFDSSLSSASSCNTWDQCYTPISAEFPLSRRHSLASIDMDGLSSSRSSMTGSVSPGDQTFLPMNQMVSMHQNMLTSLPSNDPKYFLYTTPCSKPAIDASMMNFEYPNVNINLYSPVESQDFLLDMPNLSFDHSSSPLPLGSSPHSHPFQYINPSLTTVEPQCPSTPLRIKTSVSTLGSPMDYGSSSRPTPRYIQHFMSPTDSYTPTNSSPLSIKTNSTIGRAPLRTTMESSAALHRVQNTGSGTRIRKPSEAEYISAGRFFCDHEDCIKARRQGFRRQEHLKRHTKTHEARRTLKCEFCPKAFQKDRTDNYRSHMRLHSVEKKGARTKYHARAAALVAQWDAERSRKSGRGRLSIGGDLKIDSQYTLGDSPDFDEKDEDMDDEKDEDMDDDMDDNLELWNPKSFSPVKREGKSA